MPHGVVAQQASEQIASAALSNARTSPAQSNSSGGHFTASRLLLANRPDRASWSPPQSKASEHNGHQHSSHSKKHAELIDQRAPTNHERDQREGATSGRRRGWRRDSSHELSLSPSSSSLDEHEHDQDEDDDQEGAVDESMSPSGQAVGGSSAGKPHVGPMGIFFKVWSLVKVTKARHNKMKRQHSEDAGQMHHFALADHPANGTLPAHSSLTSAAAAAAPGQQTHLMRQAHLLQDNHFRRAGSQPPPSSHLAAIGLARGGGGGGQAPLVSGDGGALESTGLLQTTTTGTNGSSSGVSSTASSTIATNSYASGVERAGSTALVSLQQQQRQQRQQPAGVNNNKGSSWASRMKRSTVGNDEPTGGAGSSYVSRYRFRRGDHDQRQVAGAITTGSSSATPTSGTTTGRQSAPNVLKQQQVADGKRQSRAYSEANQLDELRRRQAQRSGELKKVIKPKLSLSHLRSVQGGPLRRDSISDEDWAAEEEEEREDEEEQRTLADSEEEGDESDPNDIYSTPNDSIQSVPSGGRLPETTTTTTQLVNNRLPSTATKQAANPSYQMTKSFSTNNFNTRHAHKYPSTGSPNLKQIEESKVLGSTTRLDSGVVIAADDDEQQRQQQQQAGAPAAAARTQRSSNGSSSRFFISSSSSEDSNTPQQLQRHQQLSQRHSSTATVRAVGACQQVGVGLHYHAPPPTRPDSLLIPTAPSQLSRQQPPNLMTPSAMIINGLGEPSASVATMSPMFPLPTGQLQQKPSCQLLQATNYKKSPSLFEMSSATSGGANLVTRFSSKYPYVAREPLMMLPVQPQTPSMSSFVGNGGRQVAAQRTPVETSVSGRRFRVPHSISLHDCKLTSAIFGSDHRPEVPGQQQQQTAATDQVQACKASEYKLAQMLLELGRSEDSTSGRPTLKDQRGYTALMHAIISENLSAIKCLIEHGVDLNEINNEGQSALDLVCSKQVVGHDGETDGNLPLEMMKLLIAHQVDFDRARESDGSRLLDRLIGAHDSTSGATDKLAYIDCLLHNGAKLGSATWAAASGKHEVQLRLLRKLCQDGYFLYKKSSIEAAVYRFEYALKRISALEQQLDDEERRSRRRPGAPQPLAPPQRGVPETGDHTQVRAAVQQVKYQTFLGLSRCERKRRFFKRALEFAHMSILVDSIAYEGYYSKAHILKDLGETDDALLAIDQTERLVVRSIETVKSELCDLKNQQEAIVFDGCFQVHDPQRARWIESSRGEIENTLDYLLEAKKHIAWLRAEILDDKKRVASVEYNKLVQ